MLEFKNYNVTLSSDKHGHFCDALGITMYKTVGDMDIYFWYEFRYILVDYAIKGERMYLMYEEPNFYA